MTRDETALLKTATLALVIIAVACAARSSLASCWASNPNGDRTCRDFLSPNGRLKLNLCEDNPGDCQEQGYTPVPHRKTAKARHSLTPETEFTPEPAPKPTAARPEPYPSTPSRNQSGAWKRPDSDPNPASFFAFLLAMLLGMLGLWLLPPQDRIRVVRASFSMVLVVVSLLGAFIVECCPRHPLRGGDIAGAGSYAQCSPWIFRGSGVGRCDICAFFHFPRGFDSSERGVVSIDRSRLERFSSRDAGDFPTWRHRTDRGLGEPAVRASPAWQ